VLLLSKLSKIFQLLTKLPNRIGSAKLVFLNYMRKFLFEIQVKNSSLFFLRTTLFVKRDANIGSISHTFQIKLICFFIKY